MIFNNLADIKTGEGIPPFLFNLAGISCWNYFKECLIGTSDTFKKNETIFGKVYFPRVIMPMATVVSNLIKFGIQLLVFIGFYLYFKFFTDKAYAVHLEIELLFFPVLVFIMGILGLGLGMIISSMTTKYRDLTFLVTFGVQLLMYGSAVMYPLAYFKEKIPQYSWLIEYNPMSIIIEVFRYISLGQSEYISNDGNMILTKITFTIVFSIFIFLLGLIIFNKTEKRFIDTV